MELWFTRCWDRSLDGTTERPETEGLRQEAKKGEGQTAAGQQASREEQEEKETTVAARERPYLQIHKCAASVANMTTISSYIGHVRIRSPNILTSFPNIDILD